jgi:muconolactone delta-isomerase
MNATGDARPSGPQDTCQATPWRGRWPHLIEDLGRWAGGWTVDGLFGLLAAEQEHLAADPHSMTAEEARLVDYLVTMTTHVPERTPSAAVADIQARESMRSRELSAQGHLLRLWRPPLRPGEWRTLGLFAATDDDELERILASMPLRIWRSDEVMPLAPHPNDPPARDHRVGVEFLTVFSVTVPVGTPSAVAEDTRQWEARRARQLAEQGHLVRLWMLPSERNGPTRTLGLWRADHDSQLRQLVESLPLYAWMTAEITPLTPHPGDPAATGPGYEPGWLPDSAARHPTPFGVSQQAIRTRKGTSYGHET